MTVHVASNNCITGGKSALHLSELRKKQAIMYCAIHISEVISPSQEANSLILYKIQKDTDNLFDTFI